MEWIRTRNGDYLSLTDDAYSVVWQYHGETGKRWFVRYRGRTTNVPYLTAKAAKAHAERHNQGGTQ